MKNGFTLLKLIINLSILAILVTVAAPSFSGLLERALIDRTTTEFRGLFVQAKSEAVMRSSTVYIHTVGIPDTPTKTDNWCIIVSKNLTETSCTTASNIISIIQGENLNGLTISRAPIKKLVVATGRFKIQKRTWSTIQGFESLRMLNKRQFDCWLRHDERKTFVRERSAVMNRLFNVEVVYQ